MKFDQVTFWLFFVAVLTAWRLLPFAAGKVTLIAASGLFYAWWRPEYVVLLVFSAAVDYAVALRMAAAPTPRARRTWLVFSLVSNLGLLAFFKYTPLALDTLASVVWHLGGNPRAFELDGWVVPVGISFYTFQTLSYSIDVYRGQLAPVRSFGDFLLYVSFFPQLVAGPIVRASEFLPQLARRRKLTAAAVQLGLYYVVQGLFLKVVVADNLAPHVERVFDHKFASRPSALEAWLAAFYFGGQIFADFAGYSRIAIGLAYLMGFRFPENFRYPYLAQSLSEFWTRWHISLSSWLRDYLYIPLGGNRRGAARTYVNLMVTMLLGGLWHGAAWTFVAWGALHGLALALERACGGERTQGTGLRAAARMTLVLVVVHAAWVLFRADSLRRASTLLYMMFVAPCARFAELLFGAPMGMPPNPVFTLDLLGSARPVVLLLPIVALHMGQWRYEHHGLRKTALRRAIFAGFAALALVLVERDSAAPFIYFQF